MESLSPLSISEPSDLISSPHFFINSSPKKLLWRFFITTTTSTLNNGKPSSRLRTNAVYTTQGIAAASAVASSNSNKFAQQTKRNFVEPKHDDDISLFNERIRRDHAKRDDSRNAVMDSEESDKYIQLVREQQQRGLRKLKGEREGKMGSGGGGAGGKFNYKVDPYLLRCGDYVVHKKVGVGRFISIKFDVPSGSKEAIEYVFIEYSDGMAKLPVKQASRMLYRYNLYVLFLLPYKLQ